MPRNNNLNWKTSRVVCLALAVWLSLGALGTAGAASASRPHPPPAQASTRALELKDYYRIESIGSPAISPDGKLVAFVRTHIVEADNRRNSEIWLVPSDGSSLPKRITDPAISSSNPRWSPDGKLLAFSAARRRGANAVAEESRCERGMEAAIRNQTDGCRANLPNARLSLLSCIQIRQDLRKASTRETD